MNNGMQVLQYEILAHFPITTLVTENAHKFCLCQQKSKIFIIVLLVLKYFWVLVNLPTPHEAIKQVISFSTYLFY